MDIVVGQLRQKKSLAPEKRSKEFVHCLSSKQGGKKLEMLLIGFQHRRSAAAERDRLKKK